MQGPSRDLHFGVKFQELEVCGRDIAYQTGDDCLLIPLGSQQLSPGRLRGTTKLSPEVEIQRQSQFYLYRAGLERRSYPSLCEPLIRGGDPGGYRWVLVRTSDPQSCLRLHYARSSDSNIVVLRERFANQRLQ